MKKLKKKTEAFKGGTRSLDYVDALLCACPYCLVAVRVSERERPATIIKECVTLQVCNVYKGAGVRERARERETEGENE